MGVGNRLSGQFVTTKSQPAMLSPKAKDFTLDSSVCGLRTLSTGTLVGLVHRTIARGCIQP